jgi:signal transduction histidine kinase
LVDLHGGSVQAESSGPGKGAKLTVELPCICTEPLP